MVSHDSVPCPTSSFFFFQIIHRTPRSTLFPYTTLFRSKDVNWSQLTWPERRVACVPMATRRPYPLRGWWNWRANTGLKNRSEEHTSELQSRGHLVCRLLLEKKKKRRAKYNTDTSTVKKW